MTHKKHIITNTYHPLAILDITTKTISQQMDINPNKQSLTSTSIAALKWNYLGRLISLSLQFTIGIILARLLGPEPFGLTAWNKCQQLTGIYNV